MKKKKFKPEDWLPGKNKPDSEKEERAESSPTGEVPEGRRGNNELLTEVEYIISQLESQNIDITSTYTDWRDIGFAFADAFGEEGRQFFHRISVFYPTYSKADCDKQFDYCLKSHGSGITMKSFYHLAKIAGINISQVKQDEDRETHQESLPTIPDSVYDHLPDFLKQIVRVSSSPNEKDLLLLGSLVTLSSCMTRIYGIYHNKKVYSNLYLFVIAHASAGKGILIHCKQLVYPIHKHLREESKQLKEDYEKDLNQYNASKKKNPDAEKPEKPPVKLLFIPANSSATGAFQLLNDNDGVGIIFESEGDTLANTFKTDYGNYSDGFRKSFHHENISYFRRTDNEHVEIEHPRLSALLSGTPNQVTNLISDAENGLFSRFMFYYLDIQPVWIDVFERYSDTGLDDYFAGLGEKFYEFYHQLTGGSEIEFMLTADQKKQFNSVFSKWQSHYQHLLGIDYLATVRRLGLITFRTAMIFSTLRLIETGELPNQIICEEVDFKNAIAITEVLIKHAGRIFSELPEPVKPIKRKNLREKFYDMLPAQFSRQEYVTIASKLNIPDKTAQGYIAKFCKSGLLHHEKQDLYIKPTKSP